MDQSILTATMRLRPAQQSMLAQSVGYPKREGMSHGGGVRQREGDMAGSAACFPAAEPLADESIRLLLLRV